jgi:6-phosphogluconolactonase
VSLSGGETPVRAYALLGSDFADSVPWYAVHVSWGDERCIPLDRPDSHFTMATGLMLSRVPIPAENVHGARGDAPDPAAAAAEYEEVLRSFFAPPASRVPRLELVLLGWARTDMSHRCSPTAMAVVSETAGWSITT